MTDGPARSRLEEIRRARGMKAIDLCRRGDINPSNLWRIETGKAGISQRRVRSFARILQVSVDQLLAPIGAPITFSQRLAPVDPRPYQPEHALPEVAARLRALLTDLGLSADEVPPLIGAAAPDLRDWLAGRVLPPFKIMDRLAMRAGVTMAWIYYGDGTDLLPGVTERLRKLLPDM